MAEATPKDRWTLYFAKGSSALAAHILLEDSGLPYRAQEVSIDRGAHRHPAYLAINPLGRIPALETPQGVLTENPAILEYIATCAPDACLRPEGAFDQARARAFCAYLCATVHVAFAHGKRAARWADSPAAQRDMARKVPSTLAACADRLEAQLAGGDWAMGDAYSYCDPYLFLVHRWMAAHALDIARWPRLAAHRDAMRARPAVRRAMAQHGLA